MGDIFFDQEVGQDVEFLGTYENEKEYRADKEAYNYSKIADFLKSSPNIWKMEHIDKTKVKETSDDMLFGSMVDCHLFTHSEFNKRFALCSAPVPTASIIRFVDELISLIDISNGLKEGMFEEAYNNAGIKNPKFPKFMENFNGSDSEVYFAERLESKGKTVYDISVEERKKRVCDNLIFNPNSKHYFNGSLHQLAIKFSYKGILMRVMLDGVKIDDKRKEILPWDLKVTAKPLNKFDRTFLDMKYYIQQAMYTAGVKAWAEVHYPDYKVLDYEFVVTDNYGYLDPVVFKIHPPEGQSFMYNFDVRGYTYKGVIPTIEEIEWHIKNDVWTSSKEVRDNKGKMIIQL